MASSSGAVPKSAITALCVIVSCQCQDRTVTHRAFSAQELRVLWLASAEPRFAKNAGPPRVSVPHGPLLFASTPNGPCSPRWREVGPGRLVHHQPPRISLPAPATHIKWPLLNLPASYQRSRDWPRDLWLPNWGKNPRRRQGKPLFALRASRFTTPDNGPSGLNLDHAFPESGARSLEIFAIEYQAFAVFK